MKLFARGFAALALLCLAASPAFAQTQVVATPASTLQNINITWGAYAAAAHPVTLADPLPVQIISGAVSATTSVKATASAPTYVEGSTTNPLSSDLSGALRVSGSFSASSATKSTAADPSYTEGVTTNPVSVDLAGYARTLAKQTGTWNVTNISGTVSLPTGAATSANQTTELSSLSTIATNSGTQATAANQSSVIGTKAAGTAATNSVLTGVVFNTSLPTLTTGQQAALQADSSARLIVNCATGCSGGGTTAQGATTSGVTGGLNLTATTTAAPTYTTATVNPLSTDVHGSVRVLNVDSSGNAIDPTTPTSVTAASGAFASGAFASGSYASGAFSAGSLADGADVTLGTKADAATCATTNSALACFRQLHTDITSPIPAGTDTTMIGGTNTKEINGVAPLMGNGVTGTGSQRVTIASDNTAFSVNGTLQTQTDTTMVGGTNTKEINGVAPLMGNGVTGTGSQRVTIASDNTAFSVNGTLQTQTDTVMVGGTNTKEINGVAPLMGNGVTGTGSQRVTVASDNTPFAVKIDQTTNGATNAVVAVPATSGGLSTCRVVTGTTGFCKASAGQFFTIVWQNTNAAVRYLQIYNKASAPTLGTDTPIMTIPLALTSVGNYGATDLGIAASAGIAWAVTTDDIAIPATAGTSGDLHMTLAYK
jgi:hypothetical protein